MFFTLASIFQNAPNPYFELYPKMLSKVIGTFLGDYSKCEKLSEINV
jgi:hypothetical protein